MRRQKVRNLRVFCAPGTGPERDRGKRHSSSWCQWRQQVACPTGGVDCGGGGRAAEVGDARERAWWPWLLGSDEARPPVRGDEEEGLGLLLRPRRVRDRRRPTRPLPERPPGERRDQGQESRPPPRAGQLTTRLAKRSTQSSSMDRRRTDRGTHDQRFARSFVVAGGNGAGGLAGARCGRSRCHC
jgi:hypothetical protein